MAWIVAYHSVVEEPTSELMPGMWVTAKTFERHLDWLGQRFELVSLAEAAESHIHPRWRGKGRRKPLAAVTFDDGYRDNHDIALPILEKKGVPAAFFVVSDLIHQRAAALHDRVYTGIRGQLVAAKHPDPSGAAYAATRVLVCSMRHSRLEALADQLLDDVGLRVGPHAEVMSWDMVRRLHGAGMEIGSHTATHHNLMNASAEEVEAQLVRSKELLESKLGAPVRSLAYPNGDCDPAVVRAAAKAGYEVAVTTGTEPLAEARHLTVPRTVLHEGSARGALGSFSGAVMDAHSAGVLGSLSATWQRFAPEGALAWR